MSDNSPRLWCILWALLIAGLLACAPAPAGDGPLVCWPWAWWGDPAGLHHLSVCQLDDLFRRSTICELPCGWLPGEVLAFCNLPAPQLLKRVANNHWKGKHLEPDGSFINQWKHGQALASHFTVGPSFMDGQPCLVFEYPRLTPLFGPMRDEHREIAPGLFLGRQYRRVPHVKFLGYNYLRLCNNGGWEWVDLPQEVIEVTQNNDHRADLLLTSGNAAQGQANPGRGSRSGSAHHRQESAPANAAPGRANPGRGSKSGSAHHRKVSSRHGPGKKR